MFARFSTVAGERGAADAERDIRGFALKFYTEAGNWDVVGNNTPGVLLRDPLRFPDLNHAIKRDPRTGMRSADNNWDFWTLLPEATGIKFTIVRASAGIPRVFRHMHGFAAMPTVLSMPRTSVSGSSSISAAAGYPETCRTRKPRRLWARTREHHGSVRSIETGDFPRWTLFIQVMTDAQAKAFPFNPFDLTKSLAQGRLPADRGRIFRAQPEPRKRFRRSRTGGVLTTNIVPGISYSPDKMLQGRLFSYGDAQALPSGGQSPPHPVNAPKCPFQSYHRDGACAPTAISRNSDLLPQ